jgi:hypothetical protein
MTSTDNKILDDLNKYYRFITCQDPTFKNETDKTSYVFSDLPVIEDKFDLTASTFKVNLTKFLDNSVKLNNLDNNNNMSTKLTDIQKSQLNDLKLSLNDLHNTQYKTIRNYQSTDYFNNKTLFINTIFINLLLLFLIIFILASLVNLSKLTTRNLIIISSILGFLFVIYVCVCIRQNQYRNYYDWNKFYFPLTKPKQNI